MKHPSAKMKIYELGTFRKKFRKIVVANLREIHFSYRLSSSSVFAIPSLISTPFHSGQRLQFSDKIHL